MTKGAACSAIGAQGSGDDDHTVCATGKQDTVMVQQLLTQNTSDVQDMMNNFHSHDVQCVGDSYYRTSLWL